MTASATISRPAAFPAGLPRAFTLVESMMSVLIVSGVLVAALGTLGAIGKARHTQVQRAAAVHLGERVLAEVLQCYYKDPTANNTLLGVDAGETTRTQYDDVDDYDSWQMSPPTLRDGTALPGYSGWKAKVKVDYAELNNPKVQASGVTDLKKVRVTVTMPGGIEFSLFALRSPKGAYEQLPSTTTTYLTWTGLAARVGENGKTIYGGAHPLNVVTSQ